MTAKPKLQLPGLIGGIALAPLVGLGSYLRRSRLFHPNGICLRGTAHSVTGDDRFHQAGQRLSGPVFVRFSSGWWKQREWPDVLGCALRFTGDGALSPKPRLGDQDLLLATIRTPMTTLLAPLTTNIADYLSNAYFGVSAFNVAPIGSVKLRLSPQEASPAATTRETRLMRALERAPVQLMLEARADRLFATYRPVARIELVERVELDQRALHFDPFAIGRGFEPTGFVHALRVASYAASRRARASATAHAR